MTAKPNPPFDRLKPVSHGAFDYAELAGFGLEPEDVIDFSSSINPYGPASVVEQAARRADIDRYPDRDSNGLRNALAEHLEVDVSNIAVGNGSAELIDHLARAYLAPSDTSLIVGPTFGEYERAVRLCGARTVFYNREISGGKVSLSLEELLETVEREESRVVWLCNPNNPTGDYLRRGVIERLLEAVVAVEGLLIVDEAYRDLMLWEEPDDLTGLLPGGNLALLRSMTKDHAIAGLRLGYVLAAPPAIRALRVAAPPWNVGSPAQAAGIAALSEGAAEHLRLSRDRMAHDAAYLRQKLEGLGLKVLPATANFLLARVGDGAGLRRELLEKGLQVRDCASFDLPEYVRISVRRQEECRSLISTLKPLLEQKESRL
ncbi:histidinol-phosphate transaminase [soil metagenome]